jgi:hypothetical protein
MSEYNNNKTISYGELSDELKTMFNKLQIKHKVAEEYQTNRFGYAPPILGVKAFGKFYVSKYNSLYTSDDPNNEWTHPSEFLASNLKETLGKEWLNNEFEKGVESQNIIATWFTKAHLEVEGKKDNPNGKALALLHLAYDIFVLQNINKMPDYIIDRLKNNISFNGARYELFVFATLVRAGFELEYCDEKSGTNGKVPECIAYHSKSETKISIEAKTRNVKNILGSPQGNKKKINLYDKLKNALDKKIQGPYIIFLDINLPDLKAEFNNPDFNKVRKEIVKLNEHYEHELPNCICVTNIPFHYGSDETSPANNLMGMVVFKTPKYTIDKSGYIFDELNKSLKKYDFLPKVFNEADVFADKIMELKK